MHPHHRVAGITDHVVPANEFPRDAEPRERPLVSRDPLGAALTGALVGAAWGALAGSFTDVGINDDFIKRTREQVTEGTSAVFLLTQNAVVDRVAGATRRCRPTS